MVSRNSSLLVADRIAVEASKDPGSGWEACGWIVACLLLLYRPVIALSKEFRAAQSGLVS